MTASMYQGEGQNMSAVGQEMQTRMPGPVAALQQGSVGQTMSDLQAMMENERKQHEGTYRYANGNNNGGNMPLGQASF